jgi:Trypsin-co-occurring domain 2
MPDEGSVVGLAKALEALRQELDDAWRESQDQRVRFRASQITLTVQAVARTEKKAGGKLRWWIVEAGADHTAGQEATQTLELTLTPELFDDAGQLVGPLDVRGQQPEPGK